MSAQLQVGDRVYAVVDGVHCLKDLGVVAEVHHDMPPNVAVIAWDTGDVDQMTLSGEPDGSCGAIGATPTGERWSLERTAQQLAACLEDAS